MAEPGSDGLTRAEVWKLLDTYNQQWREGHERMRNALDRNTTAMMDGFSGIRTAMESHQREDDAVALRVHDLEEREKTTAATVTKRNMAASGIIAAIVGPTAVAAFRWITGK